MGDVTLLLQIRHHVANRRRRDRLLFEALRQEPRPDRTRGQDVVLHDVAQHELFAFRELRGAGIRSLYHWTNSLESTPIDVQAGRQVYRRSAIVPPGGSTRE